MPDVEHRSEGTGPAASPTELDLARAAASKNTAGTDEPATPTNA